MNSFPSGAYQNSIRNRATLMNGLRNTPQPTPDSTSEVYSRDDRPVSKYLADQIEAIKDRLFGAKQLLDEPAYDKLALSKSICGAIDELNKTLLVSTNKITGMIVKKKEEELDAREIIADLNTRIKHLSQSAALPEHATPPQFLESAELPKAFRNPDAPGASPQDLDSNRKLEQLLSSLNIEDAHLLAKEDFPSIEQSVKRIMKNATKPLTQQIDSLKLDLDKLLIRFKEADRRQVEKDNRIKDLTEANQVLRDTIDSQAALLSKKAHPAKPQIASEADPADRDEVAEFPTKYAERQIRSPGSSIEEVKNEGLGRTEKSSGEEKQLSGQMERDLLSESRNLTKENARLGDLVESMRKELEALRQKASSTATEPAKSSIIYQEPLSKAQTKSTTADNVAEMERRNQELNENSNKLMQDNEKLRIEKTGLNTNLKQLTEENSQFRDSLKTLNKQLEDLTAKHSLLKKTHEQQSGELQALQEQIAQLSSQPESETRSASKDLAGVHAEFQARIDQLNEANLELIRKQESQALQLSKWKSENGSLTTENASLKERVGSLESAGRELAAQVDPLQSRQRQLDQEVARQQTLIDSLSAANQQLSSSTQEQARRLEDALKEAAKWKSELSSVAPSVIGLEERLGELNSSNEAFIRQIDCLQLEKTSLLSKLKTAEQEKDRLNLALVSLESKFATDLPKVSEISTRVEELNAANHKLIKEVELLKLERSNANQKLKDQEARNTTLAKELQEAEQERQSRLPAVQALKDKEKELNDTNFQLLRQIDGLSLENKSLAQQARALQERSDRSTELQKEADRLTAALGALGKEAEELKRERSNANQKLKDQEAEIGQLGERLSSLQREHSVTVPNLNSMEVRISELNQTNLSLIKQIDLISLEKNSLTSKNQDLARAAEDATRIAAANEATVARLTGDLARLKEDSEAALQREQKSRAEAHAAEKVALEAQIGSLNNLLNTANLARESADKKLAESMAEQTKASQILPREDSAAPLLAKIADLEQQLSTATSTCQKYQTEIAALRETISQKSSAIVEPLESASKAKEEPLLALQSQVSSQTATIERQAAEIARLTAELREKCENQAGTHREQLEEFARNKADAEKQMLAALEATSALENERQGLEQQREKLHRKDIDLQTRQALLEATEAEVDLKLKAALQSEQITDELQKDLWAKQSFIKEKDDLIEQLNATIQELQSAGSPVAAREKRSKSLHAQRPSIEISESPPIEKIEEPTASETRDPFLKEEKPDRGRFLNPTLYYTKTESVSCDSEEELPSKNLILQDRMPPSNDEDLGLLELQKQLDALKKKDHEQAKLIEKFQKNQNDNNEHLKKLETDLKTHKELVRNLSCEKASIENLLYMVGLEKKNLIDKLRAEFAGIENCLEGSRRVIASLRQENDGLRQANLALFEHQRALEQFAQPGMRTEKPAESPQAANKSASDQGLNESQVLFTESLVKPKQTQAAAQNLKAPRKDSAADWLESEEEAHYDSEKKEPRGEPQQKPDVLFHHSKTQEARATQPAPFRSEIEPTSARSGKSNPKHVAPQQKHRRADNNSHARRDRDDDEYVPKRNPGADSRPSDKHRAAGRSTGSNEYERKSLDAPPAKQAEQPHQREKQLMSQSATNLKQAAVRPEEPRQSKGASQREPTSEERRAAPQGEFVFVEENFKVNSEPDFFKASKASIVEVPPASFTKQLDVGDFDSADDEDSGWISVPDKQPRHLTESCVEQQPVSAAKGKPKGPNPYMSDSLKSLSAAKPDRAPQESAAKAVSQFGPEEPGLGKKSERSSLQPEPDTPSSRNFATKEKEEVRSNLASSQFLSQQGDDCDEESGSKKGAGSLLESRLWADALPEDNFFEETTQFDDIQDSLQKKFESVMGESKASGSQASPSKKKKKNKTAQPQN